MTLQPGVVDARDLWVSFKVSRELQRVRASALHPQFQRLCADSYPVRGIRSGNLLYLHNFKPERWPCGDPDLGLKDTDAGPTKSFVEKLGAGQRAWEFCFGKRPQEELFDLSRDADCVQNLAGDASLQAQKTALREKLFATLEAQRDPRVLGKGDVFDNYPTAKKQGPAAKKAKAE